MLAKSSTNIWIEEQQDCNNLTLVGESGDLNLQLRNDMGTKKYVSIMLHEDKMNASELRRVPLSTNTIRQRKSPKKHKLISSTSEGNQRIQAPSSTCLL